jgi:hypothetical protein
MPPTPNGRSEPSLPRIARMPVAATTTRTQPTPRIEMTSQSTSKGCSRSRSRTRGPEPQQKGKHVGHVAEERQQHVCHPGAGGTASVQDRGPRTGRGPTRIADAERADGKKKIGREREQSDHHPFTHAVLQGRAVQSVSWMSDAPRVLDTPYCSGRVIELHLKPGPRAVRPEV